ncbi:hypothetical protein PHJA_001385900 [Phtheirospermum japonicum]|uniref:Uncharacterized protein n=1 Tax=Phtheirospermum japonicum TaxID=374723 RepID=A0A830BWH7_9LAMI|nr:hypothetical protein PHJA_001385900 [Phtheirospermum japonicum]
MYSHWLNNSNSIILNLDMEKKKILGGAVLAILLFTLSVDCAVINYDPHYTPPPRECKLRLPMPPPPGCNESYCKEQCAGRYTHFTSYCDAKKAYCYCIFIGLCD